MDVIEDLITSAEAAELLGLDRSGIIRRIQSGQLKPAKTLPGRTGSHLFSRADVLALSSSAERPPLDGGPHAPAAGSQPGSGGTSTSAA